MSEDVKHDPSRKKASSLAQVLAEGNLDQPADKPSRVAKLAIWAERMDTTSASLLTLWLRTCSVVGSGLGVFVLFMLVLSPDSIQTIVDLVELIISSGRGFAIPTLALIALLPKLVTLFADLRE